MSPLAQLAPPATLTTYVVHRRDGATTTTRTVQATSPSAALVLSRLGAGVVHDAKFTKCGDCSRTEVTR